MPLFRTAEERRLAEAISGLAFGNPFTPQRRAYEKQALGDSFIESGKSWSLRIDQRDTRANVALIRERLGPLVDTLRERLVRGSANGTTFGDEELRIYEELANYHAYDRYRESLQVSIGESLKPGTRRKRIAVYDDFLAEAERTLNLPGFNFATLRELPHLFALFFQVRRAFHHIFGNIVGSSAPATRLRAAVWQSIFTHDMRRYRRVLFDKLSDVTTLVTGPTGTGKELVARAIGLSRYIPFDPKTQTFTEDFAGSFHALNLSALSPTLIESEIFGHKRGSFTGAQADRVGWLEACPPLGTVFLDEIGDLDPIIQVKLLRVLQTRTFQRLGDGETKQFKGKIIAATNRDLAAQMHAGEFRSDFYYRLCSDIITTPSLHEQLTDAPDDLRNLVRYLVGPIVGDEADAVADEVEKWIHSNLGDSYPWPGNVRELEQCVRNIIIRGEYRPPRAATPPRDLRDRLGDELWNASITADSLLSRYCTLGYARYGNYQETAARLGLDRRTVKAHVDAELLREVKAGDDKDSRSR